MTQDPWLLRVLRHPFFQITRLNKPIGILLLLWPTLVALWISGQGSPPLHLELIFSLGVVLMRSAGCIINDWVDRAWDKEVARTRHRPLTSGQLSEKTALLWFALLLGAAASLLLALPCSTWPWALGAVICATIYPFMKRYTHLPQAVLGLAFAWGIPMTFVAQGSPLDQRVAMLMTAVLAWVMAYDTQYAMVDREDDLKVGIKSTAILFGVWDRWAIGFFQAVMLGILWHQGCVLGFGRFYNLALSGIGLLFFYQQALMRGRKPENCFQAFLNNQHVGLLWFLGVVFSQVP